MRFGRIPTAQAAGQILAHSLQVGAVRLKKGVMLSSDDIDTLRQAGIAEVTVASLDNGDIGEDGAADRVARALTGAHVTPTQPVAGRVNLVAAEDGVLRLRPDAVLAVNRVDEAITLATLADFARVRKGTLLATIKIIPYGVPDRSVAAAVAAAGTAALSVAPFVPKTCDLILTRTPGLRDSLLDKGRKAVQTRAAALGWTLQSCSTVDHDPRAVADALAGATADVVLVLGASATSDRQDVIPAGLATAGGTVTRFGMPVDPGNLLVLGQRGDQMVVGLPGCARAPALNGTDWVLERIAVDLPVTDDDIARMGLGGLLKEIPERIQPRALRREAAGGRVAAVLLAAGASSRMAPENKLLRNIDGIPLLRRSAQTLLEADIGECIVVIPPGGAAHCRALDGLGVTITEAADAGLGMSASLRAGVAALGADVPAVLVALADMPDLTPEIVNRVIAAHDPSKGRMIVCPEDTSGRRGHPVLFDRRFLENLQDLSGDKGAREVLRAVPEAVHGIRLDAAVTRDLDTPQDWAEWERSRRRETD